jgi:hypothetical protein
MHVHDPVQHTRIACFSESRALKPGLSRWAIQDSNLGPLPDQLSIGDRA